MTENQLKYLAYQENVRHNQATEEDTDMSIGEQARANRAREYETQRSNKASEQLKSEANTETVRSNMAKEEETRRHNMRQDDATDWRTANEVAKTIVSGGLSVAKTALGAVG